MKLFQLILLCFILGACGKMLEEGDAKVSSHYVSAFTSSDPTFDNYKNDFEDNYYQETGLSINTSAININFVDSIEENSSFIAVCIIWGNRKDILVKTTYWDAVGEDTKQSIIHHELGHCALGKGHNNEIDEKTGRPLSLMHSNIVSGTMFMSFFEEYIQELFNQ
ncbi:hypothetical protein M899_0349 [Bacteriovorax sp. BSW11_IV]|uniref:hypothetical protein n=1 Tax=Bacteriovorax sp. BSW11_IV TaxID=1353529 RepID=UPI00038A2C20|nr:hypothetical protein [Bacteriovorax sp. BSW11_IV]EQC50239.1 hypothetical protein M899_0349 [Bacteriovorax sp. BSW11_IV]